MKTIRQIADEIGVSKQAVSKNQARTAVNQFTGVDGNG